ncbi:hypothetical protein OUZ56_009102 [Daphnia magna]|uniref:THAP-type domain-containing protein n=1 Tax=Daphnia magna TaxID=35525 RepID=A0ABR0AF11_9CRUS|nr:hypothetical protein OUZ56_009102 [Daphnia magna]
MRKKCCVINCLNKNYGKGVLNQKVTYHTFPKDENRIEKWIKHLHSSVENGSSAYSLLKFSDYTVISSDHFEENFTGNTKILKKSAVPTLFKKVAVIQANEQINMIKINIPLQSSLENEVTAKASSSKKIYRKQNGSPFYGNKLQRYQYVMKKLRKMASSLQKSVNKITTLVGEENIELLKEDPRMRKCITCVRKIIEQEGNKNCDANAKSSFLFIR